MNLFKSSISSALIKKWKYANIYGKGRVAKSIKKRSIFSATITKSPLLCLNPVFAFWFRTKFEKSPKLESKRTVIQYPDGGEASLDQMLESNLNYEDSQFLHSENPVILVIPGISENTWSTKVQTLISTYLRNGYNDVFICNYRGRCMTPLKTTQLSWPFGRFNDIQYVVAYIKETFPNRKIILVGNCFGGMCIVDYLTSQSYKVPDDVIGGVVHSIQWNVHEGTKLLMKEPFFSFLVKPWASYTKNILLKQRSQDLCEKVGLHNFKTFSSLPFDTYLDIDTLWKTGLGFTVDNLIKDSNDYAALSSPHLKIRNFPVAKPLVIINSIDDPVAPISMEELEEIEKDPGICLSLLSCGGHCAFVKSMLPTTNFIDDIMLECSNIVVHDTYTEPSN